MNKIYGVTGQIGCGKSYVCQELVNVGKSRGLIVEHINCDLIGREFIGKNPKYQHIRDEFKDVFDSFILNDDGSIDKKEFSQYLTRDEETLNQINEILLPHSLSEVRRRVESSNSILTLVESALFVEHDFLDVVDYNMVLVNANKVIQKQRYEKRDCPYKNSNRRSDLQLSYEKKLEGIISKLQKNMVGSLVVFDTSYDPEKIEYEGLFNRLI